MSLTIKVREKESIQIGPDITLWVKKANGSQCSVTIQAPKEIQIHRMNEYGFSAMKKTQELDRGGSDGGQESL